LRMIIVLNSLPRRVSAVVACGTPEEDDKRENEEIKHVDPAFRCKPKSIPVRDLVFLT